MTNDYLDELKTRLSPIRPMENKIIDPYKIKPSEEAKETAGGENRGIFGDVIKDTVRRVLGVPGAGGAHYPNYQNQVPKAGGAQYPDYQTSDASGGAQYPNEQSQVPKVGGGGGAQYPNYQTSQNAAGGAQYQSSQYGDYSSVDFPDEETGDTEREMDEHGTVNRNILSQILTTVLGEVLVNGLANGIGGQSPEIDNQHMESDRNRRGKIFGGIGGIKRKFGGIGKIFGGMGGKIRRAFSGMGGKVKGPLVAWEGRYAG